MSARLADAPRPTSRTCAGCIHWLKLSAAVGARVGAAGAVGECRAGPPLQDWRWQRTKEDDWCGCHRTPSAKPLRG
jgi:hypothetical protein